jgi:hypothetical protein
MVTLKEAVVDELLENSSMDQEEADTWGNALSFHHQWMVLSREHAAALVHHRRDIILVRGRGTAGCLCLWFMVCLGVCNLLMCMQRQSAGADELVGVAHNCMLMSIWECLCISMQGQASGI